MRLSIRLPVRLPVRWATVLPCCTLAATPAQAQEIGRDAVAQRHLFHTALAIQPALRHAFVERARQLAVGACDRRFPSAAPCSGNRRFAP